MPQDRLISHLIACGALLTSAALTGCDAACRNEVVASVRSPSGKASAAVFNRNCGATTGFNTQISVWQQLMVPNEGGNVFIADGTLPVTVRWLSETELLISGVQGAKTFKQELKLSSVNISYD